MIKVLIVDDEILVAENIKASFNWKKFGFEVIGVAHNGKQALEIIDMDYPDIVVTDVKMPIMDGIELIKTATSRYPTIKFVIISGYADFEYAKQALELGTVAYCLKPLEENEFERVMLKLKSIITQQEDFNFIFLDQLENNSANHNQPVYEYLNQNRYKYTKCEFLVFSCYTNKKLKITHRFNTITLNIALYEKIFIIENKNQNIILDYMKNLINEYENNISIGFGGKAFTMNELSNRIKAAREVAFNFFLTGKHGFFNTDLFANGVTIGEQINQLQYLIERKEARAIETYFANQAKAFAEGKASLKDAFRLYNSAIYFITKTKGVGQMEYAFGYNYLTRKFENAQKMCESLSKQSLEFITRDIEVQDYKIKNEIIKNIVKYINENFWSDISIKNVADKYYINMSYLCQLFKKETGNTLMEYVSNLRIKYACKLLEQEDFKVNQVCEKVGYQDYYHFNKVFKNIIGKTPIQYAKEFKSEQVSSCG